MSKYCELAGKTTNCTDDCKECLEEEHRAKNAGVITKERFDELGLGCEKESCIYFQEGECEGNNPYEIAECVDDERLCAEMTVDEYFAYRHNGLTISD